MKRRSLIVLLCAVICFGGCNSGTNAALDPGRGVNVEVERGMINKAFDFDLSRSRTFEFTYRYYASNDDPYTYNFYSYKFTGIEYRNQVVKIKK